MVGGTVRCRCPAGLSEEGSGDSSGERRDGAAQRRPPAGSFGDGDGGSGTAAAMNLELLGGCRARGPGRAGGRVQASTEPPPRRQGAARRGQPERAAAAAAAGAPDSSACLCVSLQSPSARTTPR